MRNTLIAIALTLILSLILSCNRENSLVSKAATENAVRIFIAWPDAAYAPYYSWERGNQEPTGLEVSLIKAVLAKAELNYVFVPDFHETEHDPRIDVLTKNRADISLRCISITDERKKLVDFTIPYYEDGVGVLVNNSSNIMTQNDLVHKRVVVATYTTSYEWLVKEIKSFKIIRHYTEKDLLMLDNDEADALIADYSYLNSIRQNNPKYRLLDKKFTKEPWAIAVNKRRPDLLKVINSTLSSMLQSGELDGILAEYNKTTTIGQN